MIRNRDENDSNDLNLAGLTAGPVTVGASCGPFAHLVEYSDLEAEGLGPSLWPLPLKSAVKAVSLRCIGAVGRFLKSHKSSQGECFR